MRRLFSVLFLLGLASFTLSAQPPEKTPAGQSAIKITARVSVAMPAGFELVEQKTTNLTELVQKQNGKLMARVAITTEQRKDAAEAVHRLLEIANEADGKRTFTQICGWPALERVYQVTLAHLAANGEKVRKPFQAGEIQVQAVTVAVAESDQIVRLEGLLQPGMGPEEAVSILGLAHSLSCSTNPHPEETQRSIEKLKLEPLRHPSQDLNRQNLQPGEPERPRVQASRAGAGVGAQNVLGHSGIGEVQIAASRDGGRQVVLGTNNGTSFSHDFGSSFAQSNVSTPFNRDGDPTLGIGASGTFYEGFVGFPDGSAGAGGVSGCADSVFASTDNGENFNFVGHAAFCPLNGNGICLPDQPQMAADNRNSTPSGDQLYMVWRNFPNPGGNVNQCNQITVGGPTPTISCSVNGGRTWQHQTAVGMGDLGRITVGSDGFVYVTFLAGGNLMFNKFSSCADGLAVQRGFPVVVAPFAGVSCPIPGLDRCGSGADSSPQPAAVSRDFSNDIFIAYAERRDNQSDDIVVRASHDGGSTWPDRTVANDPAATGRRFLPWVCTSGGAAQVTWYDRRAATANNNSLTSYFWNRVYSGFSGFGSSRLIAGTESNISGSADPQCASGFPGSVDNNSNPAACQPPPTNVPGVCRNGMGGGSGNSCNLINPACPVNENCQGTGGIPKYGDYNGNTCAGRKVFMAWASATPPAGVSGAPGGINVYSNAVSDTLPVPPPTVTSVMPNFTPCHTGTQISITGTNFIDVRDVTLMSGLTDIFHLDFTVTSSTHIAATIPNSIASGPYEVVVHTPQGTSIIAFNLPHPDLFFVNPTVTGISPGNGPATGGTEVTVNGTCFTSGMNVFFGNQEAAKGFDQCASNTQCVVYSPAVPLAGVTVDVVADIAGARSAIVHPGDQFSYSPPSISDVSPRTGPMTGGTWIEITGSGFPPYDGITILNMPVVFKDEQTNDQVQAMAECNLSECSVVTPKVMHVGPTHIIATAFGASSMPSPADVFTFNQFPKLTKFQLPDSFFGVGGGVFLDGNAPDGDAVVTLNSSDQRVVSLQPTVRILAGSQSAVVPITFQPTPRSESVTLTAAYQGSSVSAVVNVSASPPLSLVIDATELSKGESAAATVTLSTPAPAGAVVMLSSSDSAAIAVPPQVPIPAGGYIATFTITNNYSGRPKSVTISATYNGASASDSVLVPTPPPRHCIPQRCNRGFHWDPDACRCLPGIPQ